MRTVSINHANGIRPLLSKQVLGLEKFNGLLSLRNIETFKSKQWQVDLQEMTMFFPEPEVKEI